MIDKIKPETINNLLTEDASLRKANAKVYPLGSNKYHAAIHLGDIHYKDNYSDNLEQWKDIDLTWSGNRIDKAPYILVRDGNVFTVTDKRTGLQSLIELSAIGTTAITKAAATAAKVTNLVPNVDFEIIPQNHQIRFQRTIKTALAAKDARFKISGDLPIKYQAYDADGEPVELVTAIVDGVLTETVKEKAGLKYPIKVDPTLDLTLGASNQDIRVYYNGSAWEANLTATSDRLGYNTANGQKEGVGHYWSGGPPQGAQIDTAYITVMAQYGHSTTTVNARITGNKQAVPAVFSNINDYKARRGTVVGGENNNYITTAQVDWDNIPAWTKNTAYNTPEIKTVVQELVNQAGYNGILASFLDDHDGRTTVADTRVRYFYSWDVDPAKAPVLHVEYTYFMPRLAYYFQNIMR